MRKRVALQFQTSMLFYYPLDEYVGDILYDFSKYNRKLVVPAPSGGGQFYWDNTFNRNEDDLVFSTTFKEFIKMDKSLLF